MAEELDNQEIQILSLQDEDGNNRDFEILDELEYEGGTYYALLPYYENVEDLDNKSEEDTEILIMKSAKDENNDEILETIDDDDLFDKIAALFDERMDAMYPEDEKEA